MPPAIYIKQLSKSYEDSKALEDINLSVKAGELFGLIGPDGAGKTSLIRILTTLLLADSGEAKVLGFGVEEGLRQIRKRVGYMPGRFSLYQDLSVEENLRFFASIFGTTVEDNYDIIRDIYQQIEPFRTRRAGKLSGGMKQKLALSCALVHRPELLFLDEPTTGVDPVSRQEFWEILKRLQEKNITIFVSTPYMDEARLCDRVALIQHGRLLAIDTPPNIVQLFPYVLWRIGGKDQYRLLLWLREQQWVHSVFPFGESLHLATQKDTPESLLLEYLERSAFANVQVDRITPSIEDCFMEAMGATQKT